MGLLILLVSVMFGGTDGEFWVVFGVGGFGGAGDFSFSGVRVCS